MCGIAPWHVYQLCKNPFDGGRAYTPEAVGDMTLDMIYMLLADQANLRRGEEKIRTIEALAGIDLMTQGGFIKGRSADGSPIKGSIGGKSKAARIREEAQKKRDAAKKAEEEAKHKGRRRRRAK